MYSRVREIKYKNEDRDLILNACYQSTSKLVDYLNEYSESKNYGSTEFKELNHAFLRSYYAIEKPVEYAGKYRSVVANNVLSRSQTSENLGIIFVDLCVRTFGNLGDSLYIKSNIKSIQNENLKQLLTFQKAIFNYLDASEMFAECMVSFDIYMFEIRKILLSFKYINLNSLNPDLLSLIEYTIAGVYNALRHENEKVTEKVQKLELLETIDYYSQCQQSNIEMAAYMFLAYTLTEKEHLEIRQQRTIDKFISCLQIATNSETRRGKGYSVLELAKGLRILAQNDMNKKTLVDRGILLYLKKMLESAKVEEEKEALLTLWILSFYPPNKKRIEEEVGDTILETDLRIQVREVGIQQREITKKQIDESKIHESNVDKMFVNAVKATTSKNLNESKINMINVIKGLQWQLKVEEQKLLPSNEPTSTNDSKSDRHVMISYNHQYKDVAKQIAKRLQEQNMKVWIDLDNMAMETDIMEGMAKAVENSFVVCILFSKGYKDSPNTRSEAQYAFRMKKPLLFLRVQPGYSPDGWLGIMIGTHLYLDFSGKYPFEQKFEELCKTIESCKRNNFLEKIMKTQNQLVTSSNKEIQSDEDQTGHKHQSNTNFISPDTTNLNVSSWNEDQTQSWLKQNEAEWHGEESLSGENLIFLYELKKNAPNTFYDVLKSMGRLKSLKALMNFSNCLDKLQLNENEYP